MRGAVAVAWWCVYSRLVVAEEDRPTCSASNHVGEHRGTQLLSAGGGLQVQYSSAVQSLKRVCIAGGQAAARNDRAWGPP